MTAPLGLDAPVDAARDETIDTRRSVHRHPELGFAEYATTALIRARLDALGWTPLPCPTQTGAVYELRGGRPGRTVMFRADIDALPVQEEVDVPWRSEIDGLMHACGHDGHVAIGLAAAGVLAARAGDLPGRYVALFQPAEELADGAARMLAGNVLDAVAADRMLSIHLSSLIPLGQIVARPGVAMSRCQRVTARLRGAGGHGALAGSSGNVVLAVAELARRLPGVADGLEFEEAFCAASAGLLQAGTAANVVPREALLRGTVRTFTEEQARTTLDRLHQLGEELAAEFEVDVSFDLPEATPPVENDPALAPQFHRIVERQLGGSALVTAPPVTPSDDVALFLQRIPGVHFHIGARPGRRIPPSHHSAKFTIDEDALAIGTRLLAEAATEFAAL